MILVRIESLQVSSTGRRFLTGAPTLLAFGFLIAFICDASPAQKTPNEILNSAAGIGEKLVSALREYSFYAEITVETVSAADVITGKYYRFSSVSFDPAGNRQEKVLENTSTLPRDVYFGTSTVNNLIQSYQFFITPETLRDYEFSYIGREHVDELNTYVFDVKPKTRVPEALNGSEQTLKGRIWVDDQDLCVVKVAGEALSGHDQKRSASFETYYQNQERYWFPTFSSAHDTITVGRSTTRVVVTVRSTGYKRTAAQ